MTENRIQTLCGSHVCTKRHKKDEKESHRKASCMKLPLGNENMYLNICDIIKEIAMKIVKYSFCSVSDVVGVDFTGLPSLGSRSFPENKPAELSRAPPDI